MTILLFFIVLFILILVHEWGHFIVAKKVGMRVDEFGIGFPPKLFGIKKGETEYTFNALPIGGFVKIFGENAIDAEGADKDRSFVAKNRWAQSAVLVAGVAMNALFAWLLFTIVFALGVPTAVEETAATDEARLVISDVLAESPAAEASVPRGAVITSVTAEEDTLQRLTPSSFSMFTESHGGSEMTISYTIGDTEETRTMVPTTGLIEDDNNRPAIGVALALVETVRQPIHIALYEGFVTTLRGLRDIVVGISVLIYDSVRGQADFSQIAGPVGIVGLVGDAAEFGFASLLMFTAFISLNLAVINLLPFPALDGGRLLFVVIEGITQKEIRPVWVSRLNLVGFALLMILMILVTYNDILRIL